MADRYYYLGPWIWDGTPGDEHWHAPDSTVGLVDLRPLRNIEAAGFFATDAPLGSDYTLLGTQLDGAMTTLQQSAMRSLLGLDGLDAHTVLDALWEVLTYRSDPDGNDRAKPILPTHLGMMELHLGGHSLVRSHRFKGESDPAWPAIQRVLQNDYRRIREWALAQSTQYARETHQRVLTTWIRKYAIANPRAFIPSDLPTETPLTPHTTGADAFTDTNGTLLTAHTPTDGGGWSWAINAGTNMEIQSNQVFEPNEEDVCARGPLLSSDDMYSQCDVVAGLSYHGGPATRVHATADTHYYARKDTSVRFWSSKYIAGARTDLCDYGAFANGDTAKLETDGSSISIYRNGGLSNTTTDTAITGNLYAGLRMHGHFVDYQILDDFEAADLGGGSIEMSAAAAGTASVDGAISLSQTLASAVAGATSLSSALDVARNIVGSISASSTSSSAMDVVRKITGAIAGAATTSATLQTARNIIGSVASAATTAGVLSVSKTLAGVVSATSTITSALTTLGQVAMSAACAAQSSLSAALDVSLTLVGSVAGSSVTTSTLRTIRSIAGSIVSNSLTTGALSLTQKLVGSITGSSTVAGLLSILGTVQFVASVAANAVTSGAISVTRKLTGAVAGASSTSGTLTSLWLMVGSIVGSGTTLGILRVVRGLVGSITSSSTTSGLLGLLRELAGSVAARAGVSGTLSGVVTDVTMTASLVASSIVSGILALLRITHSSSATTLVTHTLTSTQLIEHTLTCSQLIEHSITRLDID